MIRCYRSSTWMADDAFRLRRRGYGGRVGSNPPNELRK
jgi:hypothetical protein